MERCPRCSRPIAPGAAVSRGGVPMHVSCIVAILLARPRLSPAVTQRMMRDLVPVQAR